MEYARLRVGLFGVGLEAYWEQFDGLKDRLNGYVQQMAEKLTASDVEVVNLGLIDTPEKGLQAGHNFRKEDVDILFLYITTYALSSTILPVVRRAKVPVIVLNLSPEASIDYTNFNKMGNRTSMTGAWLANCSACSVPEIANVFKRSNIPFHQVTGVLNEDPQSWTQIQEWLEAAKVANVMSHNRLGLMGNYYGGMLDIYANLTLQCATFGGHIEILEVDELSQIKAGVSLEEIGAKVYEFNQTFEIQDDCSGIELERAAKTAVALDKLVLKHNLGSIAYYHKGTGNYQNEDTMSAVILGNSLLTARGIPVAGEYEVKNAQAMKIMDIFGAGGSFTEYYAMDFKDDVVLMGHDGPCHAGTAEGKIKVKPLKEYHGKVGSGLSVEMSVKHGPVTLLSVVETVDGKIIFLVAEAESVAGPILEIGNTNSRYKFSIGARAFVDNWNAHGPAHHCAIGTGHISAKITKLGLLIGVETIRVC
ncbi:arabinose isomerase [Pedobacter sp. JCM 36344]|uniref:arabinose isomerase n=1 Tax=Pedobacter sp. JCM 36344 TaxID=3374280 RepID=UPI003978FCD6